MTAATGAAFREYAASKLEQNLARIVDCLGRLNDEQIWQRAGDASNAPGNLALHLSGNVRQWILRGVDGQADVRDRDAEFAARGGVGRNELLEELRTTVAEAAAVIRSAQLDQPMNVQNYPITVLEGIFHVVEHFSYHTGQIVFLTKALFDVDLAYYKALDSSEKPPYEQIP
ncbi:MAG: DUF1572 family protein [Acidobacteria bacterium]|nr:DUF1572 family protein [Acidobacteriota bacterium]